MQSFYSFQDIIKGCIESLMDKSSLIERCKQGDRSAFGELYSAYAPRMRKVCRRYIIDEAAVDDVVHDSFIVILTSMHRLRDAGNADTWILAITRNVTLKYNDRYKETPNVPLDNCAETDMSSSDSVETDIRGLSLDKVLDLVDNLPHGYGKVFRLSVLEGLSHKEIAAMLSIEPHSSSSQLARAKKMIRKMMREYWMIVLLFPLIILLLVHDRHTSEHREEISSADNNDWQIQQDSVAPIMESSRESIQKPQARPNHIAEELVAEVADTADTAVAEEEAPAVEVKETPADTSTIIYRKDALPQSYKRYLSMDFGKGKERRRNRLSVELSYVGQLSNNPTYTSPYIYKPSILPGDESGIFPTLPSAIDNWNDYMVYIANHPNAVDKDVRDVVLNIALNNVMASDDDKMHKVSRHSVPFTCSIVMKYWLNERWGLESGISYTALSSEFDLGTNGNIINECQRLHYIGIPIKGLFNIYDVGVWSVYATTGITMDIPVYARQRTNYILNGMAKATEETPMSAPWQFSTSLGIGVQYRLTPHIGLFAEPGMQYFIPGSTSVRTFRTEHPVVFSLPVGIRVTW